MKRIEKKRSIKIYKIKETTIFFHLEIKIYIENYKKKTKMIIHPWEE